MAEEKRSVIQIAFVCRFDQLGIILGADAFSPVGFTGLKFEDGYAVSHARPMIQFSVVQGGRLPCLGPLCQAHFTLAFSAQFVTEKRTTVKYQTNNLDTIVFYHYYNTVKYTSEQFNDGLGGPGPILSSIVVI